MGLIGIQFLLIIVLMLANGFFAASEIAVVSARRGRLIQQAEAGNRGAAAALRLSEEPNRFLATVQVGITLIGVFAAAFGGDVLAGPLARVIAPYVGESYARFVALTLVVLMITYLSLILGELVPKRLALQNAENIASLVARPMTQIARVAAPAVWFLTVSTQAVLTLIGRGRHREEIVTEEDVMSLVREGAEGGTLDVSERDLIERVFNFTDVTARTIMTPRTEIVAVSIDASIAEVVERVTESGYSRIPVYRNLIDTIEGIIYAKDVLRAMQTHGVDHPLAIADLVRPAVFVFEHQRIAAVLQQFKQSRTHLALVLDEYGQIDGLVTLEDVLEELTGDIADEYDDADTMVIRRPDGTWLVDGLLSYGDAEHRIGLPPRDELPDLPSFDTVAGLVLAVLERIPSPGEVASLTDWDFEVVDMDGVRVDKVLVRHSGASSLKHPAPLPAETGQPVDASKPETQNGQG